MAHAQQPPDPSVFAVPFSEEELFSAFRMTLSEDVARDLAHDIIESDRKYIQSYVRSLDPRSSADAKLPPGVESAFGSVMADDTLICLSLLSDDLHKRVQEYVRSHSPPAIGDEAVRAFEGRRAQRGPQMRPL
jgi:hypothetical protein